LERKTKTLLIGNLSEPQYHPLQAVSEPIRNLLGSNFAVDETEDYDKLRKSSLEAYDLCIDYADTFRFRHPRERAAGLVSYVSEGGGLLVIHNGISLQESPEIRLMVGARFTGHPPYTGLDFHPLQPEHPVMAGIEAFRMDEEPYRFDWDPFAETTILMEYEHENLRWPAAWAHEYGLGRIVYLMPGHHAPSFAPPVYRRLILQAAQWAMRTSSR
jgi:type 1 glutamine amidotransferase